LTDPKFLAAFSGWLRVMGEDVLSLANLLEAPKAPVAHKRAAAEALQGLSRLVELIPEGIEPLGYLEGAFGFRVIAERALTEPVATEQDELGEPGLGDHGFDEPGPDHRVVGDQDFGEHDAGDQHRSGEALGEQAVSGEAPGGWGSSEAPGGPGGEASGGGSLREQVPAEPTSSEPAEPEAPEEEGVHDGRVPRLAAEAALVAEFLGDDMPRFRERWLAPVASTRAGRAASEVLYDDELRREVQRESREWVEQYQAPELGDGAEDLVKIEAFFRTRLRRGV